MIEHALTAAIVYVYGYFQAGGGNILMAGAAGGASYFAGSLSSLSFLKPVFDLVPAVGAEAVASGLAVMLVGAYQIGGGFSGIPGAITGNAMGMAMLVAIGAGSSLAAQYAASMVETRA